MDLVPSAADDDTHDAEQDERYAADDEPMRKIELFHNGYVFHPSRLSPSIRFQGGGGWPRAGQEGLLLMAPLVDLLNCSRRPPLADLGALSSSRAATGFFGHIFSC